MRTFLAVALLCAMTVAQNAPKSSPLVDRASMDTAVDPCADFYAYSCNGWMRNNPIPQDAASWGTYSKLQEETRENVRQLLEGVVTMKGKRTANQQKVADYYGSCMDGGSVDARGLTSLRADLARIENMKTGADLAAVLAWLHGVDILTFSGAAPMFSTWPDQDAKNAQETILKVDQAGIGLPDRDYYLADNPRMKGMREKYVAHVQKMFELLGDKPEVAKENAATVMRIETALAKASMSRVERRDPTKTYHRMPIADLVKLAPSFPWTKYFTALGLKVESLNVASPAYFEGLEALLKSESREQWKTYLRWHLVHSQARFLASNIVEEDFNFFEKTMRGVKEQQPRWKRCVRFVDRALADAVSELYVAKYFPPDAKQRTLAMVKAIEAAMERDVAALDWMSDPTKKEAVAKLKGMANKIGYPDKWKDYAKLKTASGDWLGNGQRAIAWEYRRQLDKIGKPIARDEWFITPTTVNAYYNPQANDINFPAAQLQPPVFDPKVDDAPNYGAAGGIIGHELIHGFDDSGRRFDAQGNLRDWWTEADGKEFEQRTQCIIDQFSQYPVAGDVKINGKLTVGEDVADIGGLILAYMAWKEENKARKLEPIDNFTPDQRFFIAYAQTWCSNEREENLRMRAATDAHSPARWRTNGVLIDMQQFQEAFGCKTGTPMAPEKRCRVW